MKHLTSVKLQGQAWRENALLSFSEIPESNKRKPNHDFHFYVAKTYTLW